MLSMMEDEGSVIGIEHIPELAEKAVKNISKSFEKELLSGKINVLVKDGRGGFPEEAPFDCIHVGAASEDIPHALVGQLKIGGVLVIPIGLEKEQQDLVVCIRTSKNKIITQSLLKTCYVPFTSKKHQLCRL